MLKYQFLQLINGVEQVDTTSSIRIVRLEKPHVVTVEERFAHCHARMLALLLCQLVMLLYRSVELCQDPLLLFLLSHFLILVFELLYHVEEVAEFVELMLTHRSAQVNHKSDRNHAKDVLV